MEYIIEFIVSYWKAAFEVLLLTAVIYYCLTLFRGTRGAAVLTGFVILLLGVAGVTQLFQLDVINWILGRFLAFLAMAVLVIFQPELRRALAQLGSQYPFSSSRMRFELIDVLVETARSLSQKRCGGLMAVEREIGFRGVAETGVTVDAKATPELLTTIFFPNTPLHDGGVVLRGDRIISAACVFPLTQRQGLSASVGMRHRAAIGLTEETDAIVVVVSEETGAVSVAHRGHLVQGLDPDGVRDFLATTLAPSVKKGFSLSEMLRRTLGNLFLREGRGVAQEGFGAGTSTLETTTDANEAPAGESSGQHKEAGH
jgi:diadenylate cyclase